MLFLQTTAGIYSQLIPYLASRFLSILHPLSCILRPPGVEKKLRFNEYPEFFIVFSKSHYNLYTTMSKIRVAVMFGGRSAEHEVSLQSAKNVIESLDKQKYEPVLIGIDKEGRWFLNDHSIQLLNTSDPRLIQLSGQQQEIALTPTGSRSQLIRMHEKSSLPKIDVIFPVLHGPFGEDGTIQGLAKLANIPCVGAGILGSAVGMDKDVMKRLLRDADIPNARFITLSAINRDSVSYDAVTAKLGPTLFIKPANLGSSVGISKVRNNSEFQKAVKLAFDYDLKVIVEEEIKGREIECAVLGNDDPLASVPGEIIPNADFYSYQAKYVDEDGAALSIPAQLPEYLVKQVQDLALQAFRVLECQGMARIDIFLTPDEKLFINEINTIPGFTKISMYPKLWEYSGISYTELVDRLIQLAIEDHDKRGKLKISMEF
ncbi:MAG: D-alanine--D-alanine ligase [Bacteroidales bacterium]|nr:D-alanine--D-alanine ligase [Bacteroidales bacterium]